MVRKIRTFLANPALMAPMALKTAPYWPGASPPPAYQFNFSLRASCRLAQPTGENPVSISRSPGQVATPSMSARVSPASPIACSAASTVSSMADLVEPLETSDWPTPVMAMVFSG